MPSFYMTRLFDQYIILQNAKMRLPGMVKRRRGQGVWALAGGGAAWLSARSSALAAAPEQQAAESVTVWAVLFPLTVAAIGVERALEIIWNYIEWLLLSSKRWQPADLKSSQYIQFKSGSSLVLGMIFGILLVNYTGMRLFQYIAPYIPGFLEDMPAVWDVIITGVLIGAATKPIHELLGIITQVKNFFGYAAVRQRESAGAALADGILKLAESESKMMIDVPGVGPSHLSGRAAIGRNLDGEDEMAETEHARTERYVETLRRRTVK